MAGPRNGLEVITEPDSAFGVQEVFLAGQNVDVNGHRVYFLEHKLTDESGKATHEALGRAVAPLARHGLLWDSPVNFIALFSQNQSVKVNLNYEFRRPSEGERWSVKAAGSQGPIYWPTLDAFLLNFVVSHDPGITVPVVVVDPSVKINPFGQNGVNDSVKKRFDNNPAPELEKFIGRVYRGRNKKLRDFVGLSFGRKGKFARNAYEYTATHMGHNFGLVPIPRNRRFKIGDKVEFHDSRWEVQVVKHEGYSVPSICAPGQAYFTERVNLGLRHLEYMPPLSPIRAELKKIEKNKLFWAEIAVRAGYKLQEIEPLYVAGPMPPPWYVATHEKTRAQVFVGTRSSVHVINRNRNADEGAHIFVDEPEKVVKYMKSFARRQS